MPLLEPVISATLLVKSKRLLVMKVLPNVMMVVGA
jgi:hypothetical protein